jgi:hypothetical protein
MEVPRPIPETQREFRQEKMEFQDISNELYRTYVFPNGSQVTIHEPQGLNVKRKADGDSHRLFDTTGTCHYVPAGWVHLFWQAKPGTKNSYSF